MRSSKVRAMTIAGAVLVWAAWWPTAAAHATPSVMTCTWGGTATAPTGTFTTSPGATNTASTGPLEFDVTGQLGGACRGTMTYDGTVDPGGTCSLTSFHGRVRGLPGVTGFAGNGLTLFGPARLLDKNGNVVGSENANAITQYNLAHAGDCNTPQGFTKGTFSSVIVLDQASP